MSWRRFAGRAALALLLILTMLTSLTTASGPAVPGSGPPGTGPGESYTVTLITGDRVSVHLLPDGRRSVTVAPAERESGTPPFQMTEIDDNVYVIPGDVAAYVPAQLDRELFNVMGLIRQGFHDGQSSEIPLIITYPEAAGFGPMAAPLKAEKERPLPSIRGAAVKVEKNKATEFAQIIPPATAGAAAARIPGVEKIWLDQKVTVQLEQSVPQTGAPAAWAAGYDGTGIVVAVLDTGIDASHPDVAGKVIANGNFTPTDSATDRHGHGTHVAATIAGTGAASSGARQGVAPGAQLINGKVLNDGGSGDFSWIIAGMEWAAQQGAHVINMSLGGGATDGTDPLSQAVDAITEQYGVLFVIAAGNSGPGASSVSTPGAASAALTVGAVDRNEELAWFSGRGPRVGDFAIKPNVTAPGVDIVAARAAGTAMGSPVDSHYTRASGTSMAAPHVAGAAALLLQKQPDLDPAALRAALVSTAQPRTDLSVYQQGGGRVDLTRAITQEVFAAEATLDFGYFAYPQTEPTPVTRSVTFTNMSDEAVTLQLAAEARAENGAPAPAGMLTLGTTEVTVPAGGSASADVTVAISAGTYGLYGGYLTATAASGDIRVSVPLGFYYESERYTLTVQATAADGRPAGGISSVEVMNVDDRSVLTTLYFDSGVASVRVPPGNYSVAGFIFTYDVPHLFVTELVFSAQPQVAVNADTTVVLDARGAPMVNIDLGKETDAFSRSAAYYRTAANGFSYSSSFHVGVPIGATPTAPVSTGEFEFYTRWGLQAPQIRMRTAEPGLAQLGVEYMTGSPLFDGTLELPIVYAGLGYPEDFAGLDVNGAIALIQRGEFTFAQKALNAFAAGARIAVIFNNSPGGFAGTVGNDGVIPTFSLSQEEGAALRDLLASGQTVTAQVAGHPISPFQYELVFPEPGVIPASLNYTVREADLATIVTDYHSHQPSATYLSARHHWRPWAFSSFGFAYEVPVPLKRTIYVTPGVERWQQIMWPIFGVVEQAEPVAQYTAGARITESWFKQVMRPGLIMGTPAMSGQPAYRQGDTLDLRVMEFLDAANHYGRTYPDVTTAFRLYQNNSLIAQTARAWGQFPLSAEAATYRMELDVDKRAAAWSPFSSVTRTAWTFTSQHPNHGNPEVLPLLLVDYDLALSPTNQSLAPNQSNGANTVSLKVYHQPGAQGAAIAGTKLWVSYNDGETWQEVRNLRNQGSGRFQANLDRRDLPGYLSLKIEAWDDAGNRITQEVIRAVEIPARGN